MKQHLLATLIVVLVIAGVVSGVEVARGVQEVRVLHGHLETSRRAQDALMAEHSRLLLERSALSSYQNVERLAESELAMRFPDQVERLSP